MEPQPLPEGVRRRSSSSLPANLLAADGNVSATDKALVCEYYGMSVLCGRCSTCHIRTMLNTCDTWFSDKMSPNQKCKFLAQLISAAPDSFLPYASVLVSPLTHRDVLYTMENRSSAANDARQAMALSYLHKHNLQACPTSTAPLTHFPPPA